MTRGNREDGPTKGLARKSISFSSERRNGGTDGWGKEKASSPLPKEKKAEEERTRRFGKRATGAGEKKRAEMVPCLKKYPSEKTKVH